MDTDRPALTPDDCHALREFSGMTWCVRGRWISLGEILDSWVDATMRAQYSASARADALAARVVEMEAELSATERTADAERERAKRAERLLELESARVAELERSLSSTETHRQSLAHELSRAQQLEEASLKTIARKDAKIEALEAEVERIRALNPLEWQIPGTDGAGLGPVLMEWQTAGTGSGDLRGQGIQPTTRPLTTADRLPEVGDVLVCPVGGTLACVQAGTEYKFVVNDDLDGYVWRDSNHLQHTRPHEYISRADGGPVVMGGADGG